MAETSTFVKIDRNIVKWRWYKDATTFRLFIHLIINANITDCDFENITVHRGQLVTSYPHLALDIGASVKQIRTALNHLKETGEVAVSSSSKYSVITVINYDKYQVKGQTKGQSKGSQGADEGQAEGRQGATIKEYKEYKEFKNDKNKDLPAPSDFEIAMNEFTKFRKDIKKPLTDRARELILKDLEKLAPNDVSTQIAILNQSIKRGWAGVFKLKEEASVPEPTKSGRNEKISNDPGKWAKDETFIGAIQDLLNEGKDGNI